MAKERFVVFSTRAGFLTGSDKYDSDSIVFVNDAQEPGIYTHTYGWLSLPTNATANQILSYVEGKAKWIDKDYYNKSEVDQKIEDVDVSDQLVDYAKTEYVDGKIEEVEAKIPSLEGYATESWVEGKKYATQTELANVKSEILGGAGQDYDTLKEIETWITEHQDLYQALVQGLATKATIEYVDEKVEELEGKITELETKVDEAGYATEDYVDGKVEELEDKVYTKEEVDAMWAWGEY